MLTLPTSQGHPAQLTTALFMFMIAVAMVRRRDMFAATASLHAAPGTTGVTPAKPNARLVTASKSEPRQGERATKQSERGKTWECAVVGGWMIPVNDRRGGGGSLIFFWGG